MLMDASMNMTHTQCVLDSQSVQQMSERRFQRLVSNLQLKQLREYHVQLQNAKPVIRPAISRSLSRELFIDEAVDLTSGPFLIPEPLSVSNTHNGD